MRTLAMLLVASAGLRGADIKPCAFHAMYRHGHYFLIWRAGPSSPHVKLDAVGVGRYTDPLRYQVIDARSRVLATDQLPRDSSVELGDLPESDLYLVYANPGLNGVRVAVDRPYGIVADPKRRLGLNRPKGELFFYVPPACTAFRVVAQSESPKEGGRVQVFNPDGACAGEAEGELDEPTAIAVRVAAAHRGAVWSMRFGRPVTPGLFLDDLNVHLDGALPHLVTPRAEWARDLVPQLPTGPRRLTSH